VLVLDHVTDIDLEKDGDAKKAYRQRLRATTLMPLWTLPC